MRSILPCASWRNTTIKRSRNLPRRLPSDILVGGHLADAAAPHLQCFRAEPERKTEPDVHSSSSCAIGVMLPGNGHSLIVEAGTQKARGAISLAFPSSKWHRLRLPRFNISHDK